MLNSMRKAVNNIFIKLLLVMVALAFVATGLNGIFSNKSQDVVTFKYCKPITRHELAHKINEQKKLLANINNQNINSLQLAQLVLNAMIEQRLFDFLADRIKLNISPATLAEVAQSSKHLQTDDGIFDKAKFEAFLARIGISEQRYFEIIAQNLAINLIGDAFDDSNYQSKILLDALKSFFAEERKATVILADLDKIASKLKPEWSEEELQAFFKQEAEKFRVPEKRDIRYLVFDAKFFQDKKLIEEKNNELKLQQLILEYEKLLEDEVSAGTTFAEISAKFAVKPVVLQNLELKNALNLDNIKDFAIETFEAPEGELSYPLIINNEKILLIETNRLAKSFIPDFNDVRQQVSKDFAKSVAKKQILTTLNSLPQNIADKDLKLFAQKNDFDLKSGLVYAKAVANNPKIPMQMVEAIFATPEKTLTRPYVDENKIYMARVEEVKVSNSRKKMLDSSNIIYQIRQGYVQELLSFLRKINEVEINYNDSIFTDY